MGRKTTVEYYCDKCKQKMSTSADLFYITAQIGRSSDAAGSMNNDYASVEICSTCVSGYVKHLHRTLNEMADEYYGGQYAAGALFEKFFGDSGSKE